MDYKKIVIIVLLIIIIVSDIFILFLKDSVGEYLQIFSMFAIFSGIGLIIMVIINRKSKVIPKEKIDYLDDLFEESKISKKICPICNTENKKEATYCTKCGNDLKDITCPICTTVNSFDQKYCTKCDTILQNEKRHL